MKKAIRLFKWVLCQAALSLAVVCSVYAGPGGQAWVPGSSDATTVQGKAPGAANGLATLDGSSLVSQVSKTANSLAMQGETSSKNAGAITILNTPTILTTLNLGTVTSGDRIYALCQYFGTKGATAGQNRIIIAKNAGTATVQFAHDDTIRGLHNEGYSAAADVMYLQGQGIVKVTGNGTLTLECDGGSIGSNGSLAAGDGQFYIFFLKKQ